jgi:hypothetical protein
MIKRWYKPETWDELVDMHVHWLHREVPGAHISGYEYEDLDADEHYINFLIRLSKLARMVTMDSQAGKCENDYTDIHPEYIKQVKEKYPSLAHVDLSKGKELRRPYVSGFIPIPYAMKLLDGWSEHTNLVLWLCLPGYDEVMLRGGSFTSDEKFNLTKSQFKGTEFEDMLTNVMKGRTCAALNNRLRYKGDHPMKEVWKNIAWIGFSSTKHCEDDEKFQQNLLRYIKNKLYDD